MVDETSPENDGGVGARLSIEAALHHYASGLDERRWELWALAFTEDAVIDFTPMGGRLETPAGMRERLGAPDPAWLFAQHPVFNIIVQIDGDTAVARSEYLMETGRRSAALGEIIRVSGGGSYLDTLRRTAAGWRISNRQVWMKWKSTTHVSDEISR